MITTNEKQELVERVKNMEDEYLLQQLIRLKKTETHEFKPNISEAEKEALDSALVSYKRGEFIPHERLMEELKRKFPQLSQK